jgi:carbamoyltransferase
MKILGISSHYHDASAAIIIDGKVVASSAEERFTREKHDPSFPHNAISFCLDQAQIKKEDLDFVAYHEDPITKFTRNLSSSMIRWPWSLKTFLNSMKETVVSGLWIRNQISKSLNIHPRKIIYIPHHLGHASHTFLTSPFDEAAIVTLDAVGEWTSTAIFKGNRQNISNMLVPLETVPFPSSIGLVYSAFTGFLGFKVNSSENSTMALASFGSPIYAEQVRKILKIIPDHLFEVDLDYFDFSKTDSLPLTEKFTATFGPPRNYKEKLTFDCLADHQKNVSTTDQKYADIAASIQLVTEEVVLHVVRQAKKLTGANNLCLAGGVALNCVSNGKLLSTSGFKSIYCPPDPGDGGGAMGAALYLAMAKGDVKENINLSPYMGENHSTSKFEIMLKKIDATRWHRYSKLPLDPQFHSNIKIKKFDNREEMLEHTASLIAHNKIVGWVQGRFENGPRALGARSILINPANIELAKKLSATVKLRSTFRPYACSFTKESAKEMLIFPDNELPLLSKWMLCALQVKPEHILKIRAAMHIDETTRPQVVTIEENEIYFELLKKIGQKTGVEAVLNTSFNEAGHPMVNTPTEALIVFARTAMDALVVENVIIERFIV